MKKIKKFGWQAPIGARYNTFNYIRIEGDLHYCISHNFVYNVKEHQKLLYWGKPCYYTDNRFIDSLHNYYYECNLFWKRSIKKGISLKSCIRRVNKCHNIPEGTIVRFEKSWHIPNKKSSLDFIYKTKNEKIHPLTFEINIPEYFTNFKTCEFSYRLTNELRKNGFIVNVQSKNSSFILGMFKTALLYTGKDSSDFEDQNDGEIATAYGHGLKIGFSSGNNNYRGYHNGCDNILFDFYEEFDKWSRCWEIEKTKSPEEIVQILLAQSQEKFS